jgi:glycosyltransferase involved in cell wall biosynthesis
MIVKNEAKVILRSLQSVRPLIDYVLIEDSASTDGTQRIIRDYLESEGLFGEIFDPPWQDFAHNRSIALARLREREDIDYAFIIDADDFIVFENGFNPTTFKEGLTADSYNVELRSGPIKYQRPQICSNRLEFRYRGVVHEFLEGPPGGHTTGTAKGFYIASTREGVRSSDPDKYREIAKILEQVLRREEDPSLRARYVFYLAESYRDSGQKEKAIATYLQRSELGFWAEEVFVSLYNAAKLQETLQRPFDEVIGTYLRACKAVPHRIEALHGAARFCRDAGRYAEGYEIAQRGLALREPVDGLFIESWIYQYGLLDEFAVNAYWAERYDESLEACARILRERNISSDVRERIKANSSFARNKLNADQTSAFLLSRHRFQLAQSYRDCGEREKALQNYLVRAELSFFGEEEVFVSLLNAARLKEQLGHPEREVIDAYLRASAVATRAEALHGASRFCRYKRRFEEGYQFAKRGLTIGKPSNALFIEPWIYDYGLLDELAVNGYWSEHYHDCFEACQRMLREGKIPLDMYDRVKLNANFATEKIKLIPGLLAVSKAEIPAPPASSWTPSTPLGGTELMVAGVKERIPDVLAHIQLHVNLFPDNPSDDKPLVIWIHHDVDQNSVQWCRHRTLIDRVTCFVFVSHWQRERYQSVFGLPPSKCVVLRNATTVAPQRRVWTKADPLRFAYASAPFRGLSVLLDAWEQLALSDAELHIWSSMKLYTGDDAEYEPLFARARKLKGVIYHGAVPNADLKSALRNIHFLAYPSTFAETSCLAVIDAMAEGCRVIVPALGALPETTSGFAHVYPWSSDATEHAGLFAKALAEEAKHPWFDALEMSLIQQNHCERFYDWKERIKDWTRLIERLTDCERRSPPLHTERITA